MSLNQKGQKVEPANKREITAKNSKNGKFKSGDRSRDPDEKRRSKRKKNAVRGKMIKKII